MNILRLIFCLFLLGDGSAAVSGPVPDPISVKDLIGWGRIAEREGSSDKALRFYERALAKDPASLEALLASLNLAREAEGRAIATDRLEKALERQPYEWPLHLLKSRWNLEDGRLDDAWKAWETAAQLAPANPLLLAHRSFLLKEKGLTREALEAARQSLHRRETTEGLRAFAESALSLGLIDTAVAHARKVLVAEDFPGRQAWAGRLFTRPGAETFQEEALRAWIVAKPLLHEPHFLLGENKLRRHDHAGAARSFQQALSLDPSHLPTAESLAAVYDNLAQPEKSIDVLREFRDMNPVRPEAWRAYLSRLKTSDLLERLGKESAAALAASPDWAWVKPYNLYVDIRLKRIGSSHESLQSPALVALKALALTEEGDTNRARALLNEATAQSGLSPQVLRTNLQILAAPLKETPPAPPREWSVRPGETLRSIALACFGTKDRWEEIWQLNRERVRDPARIVVGMKLRVPTSGSREPAMTPHPSVSAWAWE